MEVPQVYQLNLHNLKLYRFKNQNRPIVSFEIVKNTQESFWQFVDRFEVAFKLVVNPDQFMTYTTPIKELMHDPDMHNHPLLSNLVLSHLEIC